MKTLTRMMLPCILMVSLAFMVFAQGQPKKPAAKPQTGTKMAMDQSMPYKATYSSKFEIGDQAMSKKILDIWKDWDDGVVDRHAAWFADTIAMYHADGSMAKGKDSVMAGAKRYRGSMVSAKSTIQAWIPLRSTDMNENWVAIWGVEEDTWKDGKKTATALHEIWRFNKDGKIDLMRQFEAKVPPGQ